VRVFVTLNASSLTILYFFNSFLMMSKIHMGLRHTVLLGFFGISAMMTSGTLNNAFASENHGFGGFIGLKIDRAFSMAGQTLAAARLRQETYFARMNDANAPSMPDAPSPFPYSDDPAQWLQEDIALGHNKAKAGSDWAADDGLSYRMSDDVSVTGGYQYRDSEDVDLGGSDVNYEGHEVRFGVKIKLPYE
jgi:opacity protein-like surface antigen